MFLFHKNSAQGNVPLDPFRRRTAAMARPRLKNWERRTRTIGVRVTEAEAATLAEKARSARLTV